MYQRLSSPWYISHHEESRVTEWLKDFDEWLVPCLGECLLQLRLFKWRRSSKSFGSHGTLDASLGIQCTKSRLRPGTIADQSRA